MNATLQDHCLRVSQVATKDEFKSEVVRFGRELGFDFISAMSVIDHADGHSEFISVHNAPPGFLEYFSDFESNTRDPVMRHCKHHHTPIVWDQTTYIKAHQAPKWEEQAAFGYRCGIAVVMHLPGGLHLMVGGDRDQALPKDPAEVFGMVASLQLFTAHAEEAARRVVVERSAPQDVVPLSKRELEALRWTLAGKTAWEVGRILGIAENTAVRHVYRATQKLGCRSKHHAAVKALRLGLIA